MLESFTLALAAGMVATVNPCGFALLPAYLSAFIGLDDERSKSNAVGRALAVSGVLTLGFITVFGLFGLLLQGVFEAIEDYIPYATIGIGAVLVVFGGWLLSGRDLILNIPKLDKGGADGTLVSMYLFGVSYAVASLGCTLATFLTVTASATTRDSFWQGLGTFIMFGVGMGLVVGVITVAVALAKSGIVNQFRSVLPYINRIAGGLLIIAGAYITWYGWYEVQVARNGNVDSAIIDAGLSLQARLSNLLPDSDNVWQWVMTIIALFVTMRWTQHRNAARDATLAVPRWVDVAIWAGAAGAVMSLLAPWVWARNAGDAQSTSAFGSNWTTLTVIGGAIFIVWSHQMRRSNATTVGVSIGVLFALLGLFNLFDGMPLAGDLIAAGADRSTVAVGWGPAVLLIAGLLITVASTVSLWYPKPTSNLAPAT